MDHGQPSNELPDVRSVHSSIQTIQCLGTAPIRLIESRCGDVIFGIIEATGVKHEGAALVIIATDTNKVAVRSDVALPAERRYHVMCKSIELKDRTGRAFTAWDLSVSETCFREVKQIEGQHSETYTEAAVRLVEPLQRRLAKLRLLSIGYHLSERVADFSEPKTIKSFVPFVRDVALARLELELISNQEDRIRLKKRSNECNAELAKNAHLDMRALAEINKRALEVQLDLVEQKHRIMVQHRKELLKPNEFPELNSALERQTRSLDARTAFEVHDRRNRLRDAALETWFKGLRLLEDLKLLGNSLVTVKESLVPAQRTLGIPQPTECELFRAQVTAKREELRRSAFKHGQAEIGRARIKL